MFVVESILWLAHYSISILDLIWLFLHNFNLDKIFVSSIITFAYLPSQLRCQLLMKLIVSFIVISFFLRISVFNSQRVISFSSLSIIICNVVVNWHSHLL